MRRLGVRHVAIAFYGFWAVTMVGCIVVGSAALSVGLVVQAAVAYVMAAGLAAVAVWRWRIAPRGRQVWSAFKALDAAIADAPDGELTADGAILVAVRRRFAPEVCRYTPSEDAGVTVVDTYALLWMAPLVLHHTGVPERLLLQPALRFVRHTVQTGQTFVGADELYELAAQLRRARPLEGADMSD